MAVQVRNLLGLTSRLWIPSRLTTRMANHFDCIVVGAGIIGSSAAYQLKNKHGLSNVLLLEQFPVLHSRGSSHGSTRITRLGHADPVYLSIADDALREYEQLERHSGTKLLNKCGTLWLGPKENDEIQGTWKTLQKNSSEHQLISGEQLSSVYPGLRFSSTHCGVLDKAGGVLYADKCLRALQQQFLRMGGVIHESETVTDVTPGTTASVTTTKGRYTAPSIILCPGSWAGPMLSKLKLRLPLQPQLIKVCFWETDNPELFHIDRFPTIITTGEGRHTDPLHLYGLPIEEYPKLFKLCLHVGPEVDPNRRDETKPESRQTSSPSKYLQEHFTGFKTEPSVVETCLYTVTPDRHFIIDRHPEYSNIAIGAGFSGSGFKHAPTVGAILANLALEKKQKFDISMFAMDRFDQRNKAKI